MTSFLENSTMSKPTADKILFRLRTECEALGIDPFSLVGETSHHSIDLLWQAKFDKVTKTNGNTKPSNKPEILDRLTPEEFLEQSFRDKQEWLRDDLSRSARQHGISSDEVYEAASLLFGAYIDAFPEFTDKGRKYFVWRSRKGWPK
jgi:hypothetical protein